jgi:hypothetical protein
MSPRCADDRCDRVESNIIKCNDDDVAKVDDGNDFREEEVTKKLQCSCRN